LAAGTRRIVRSGAPGTSDEEEEEPADDGHAAAVVAARVLAGAALDPDPHAASRTAHSAASAGAARTPTPLGCAAGR
jgi:hypothetical protein